MASASFVTTTKSGRAITGTTARRSAYVFTSPEALLADFQHDIARWNHENRNAWYVLPKTPWPDSRRHGIAAGRKTARIGFASPELLWKVLTAKRWELLKLLCGAGPVSIREAARRAGRDVKAVHTDVVALLAAGILDRTESGAIVFPLYEAVKVEFLLEAA